LSQTALLIWPRAQPTLAGSFRTPGVAVSVQVVARATLAVSVTFPPVLRTAAGLTLNRSTVGLRWAAEVAPVASAAADMPATSANTATIAIVILAEILGPTIRSSEFDLVTACRYTLKNAIWPHGRREVCYSVIGRERPIHLAVAGVGQAVWRESGHERVKACVSTLPIGYCEVFARDRVPARFDDHRQCWVS
jgi:hypothetical protein